jgi:hypothetical protein
LKTVTATYRVSIRVKPEAAFAYISDLTRHGEWSDHLSVEAQSPGEVQVGKEYISWGKTLYEKRRNELKVTAYQSPTYFAFMAQDLILRISCMSSKSARRMVGVWWSVR